jgi:serine/threonine-protein kinase HipA
LRERKHGAEIQLRHTAAALDRWPLQTPALSCSTPLSDRWADATAFLNGLLPEGRNRDEMLRIANVVATDIFGLLGRFGRDCAGALTIVPAGADPAAPDPGVAVYSRQGLVDEIAALPERPLAIHDDSELSLPGVGDKLLLIQVGSHEWARPVGGRPSTHILKVDHARYTGLVVAEAHCLALAKHLGLTTITPEVQRSEQTGWYLIVDRYDRVVHSDRTVTRVHQEDACQAAGVDTRNPRRKYEAEGGPNFVTVARLLQRYAADPERELHQLLRAVVFTVVIGNADCHGKNISLLHDGEGAVSLAPLYDTVPTVLWPNLKTRVGMTVSGRADINHIRNTDVLAEAARWNINSGDAMAIIDNTLDALESAASNSAVAIGDDIRRLVSERVALMRDIDR